MKSRELSNNRPGLHPGYGTAKSIAGMARSYTQRVCAYTDLHERLPCQAGLAPIRPMITSNSRTISPA